MRNVVPCILLAALWMGGCAGETDQAADAGAGAEKAPAERVLIKVDPPEPLAVPEPRTVASETDWEGKAHNKEIAVLQLINVINPVAAYITAGFERYGDRLSPTVHEEWVDTQAQLTTALTLYEDCKKRKAAGAFDRQLFLDLEQVWQDLVKTGVAGNLTKSMVDAEVKRIVG